MTPFASRRLPQTALIALAAFGLVFGAARVAHAFTYSMANGATPDRGARVQAADKKPAKKADDTVSHEGSVSFSSSGDMSVRFGARDAHHSFDAEYDSNTYGPFAPGGPGGD